MASRLQKILSCIITISLASRLVLSAVATSTVDDDQNELKLPANHRDFPQADSVAATPAHRSSRQYDSSVTASSPNSISSTQLDTASAYNSNPQTTVVAGYEPQHTSSSAPPTSAASAANLISSIASGSSDIGSLTSALANNVVWPSQQHQQQYQLYHKEPLVVPPYSAPQYPYHAIPVANQRHWPGHSGHSYNGLYGLQQYPSSLLHSVFNTPIHSSMFGSVGSNLLTSTMTPFMNKALDLPEIVCNAIALAVGTIIIGAPFLLIYLLVTNHLNVGSSPGGIGGLFGNLGGSGGLGGHSTSGGSIALTGPNSQTNGNGRRKRQANETRAKKGAYLSPVSLLSDPKRVEILLKSLASSLIKYGNDN